MNVGSVFRGQSLLAVVLAASVAPMLVHAEDAFSAGAAIVLVPLEPPPLTFGPGVDVGAALASNVGAGMSYSLSETAAQAGRALWVLSGIVMLVDAPRRSRLADRQAESAEATLNAQDLWVPTVVLAQEARVLLQAAGVTRVRVAEQVRALPGVENRERTFTMHNWYQPVKEWYQMRQSPFGYVAPEVASDETVLEVGLGNYELGSQLWLLVYTKLVDPTTGKVIKKASKIVYPDVADARTLFADDAGGFKQAFAAAGRQALRSNLRSMGLAPK
jgi:hypothetical protein